MTFCCAEDDGPYRDRAQILYKDLRSNLIRYRLLLMQTSVGCENFYLIPLCCMLLLSETLCRITTKLGENYDQKNKGKGQGARPFTGWTSLVLLIWQRLIQAIGNYTTNL